MMAPSSAEEGLAAPPPPPPPPLLLLLLQLTLPGSTLSVLEPMDDDKAEDDDGGDGGDVADVMEEVAEEEDVEEVEDVAGMGMVVMDCWPTTLATALPPPKHTFWVFRFSFSFVFLVRLFSVFLKFVLVGREGTVLVGGAQK